MRVWMVQARVKSEQVEAIEAAGKHIFEALEREQVQGIRYAVCRLPDGVTYINLLELDDGVDNPLLDLPEGQAFQEGRKTWMAEPPTSEQLTVIESYRFF